MRKILLVLLLALFSFSVRAEFKSTTVGVDGLTCSMCARGVEETLKQLDFIDSISIDLNSLVAYITFKPNTNVEIDKVREMIEDAGFTVRSLDAVFAFESFKAESDAHFAFGGNTYHFIGTKGQLLTGPVVLQFIDKPYVNKRHFQDFAKQTSFECYKNGTASTCCKHEGHLYHVTIHS